ncbi:MAG: hydantoinase/oxoprolinase family protein, partial [Chloroflexi bacterium]|nr:hydantoinase/oxoprolinase family protein [Chloroflexota bacterium]
ASLAQKGLRAPIHVLKADGGTILLDASLQCPIETVLSGPAASVVGARHLSGEDDVLVVDMGGTTSDVALLKDGRPVLNQEGATVGGWRTMVEAVAVHTFGLGGDSEARLNEVNQVVVGPRRVAPLSLLSHQHPQALDILRAQVAQKKTNTDDGLFALRQRAIASRQTLSAEQAQVWDLLADGLLPLADLLRDQRQAYFRRLALSQLVDRGAVVISGFTPTDAAHVLGHQDDWSVEAARIGAELWARRLNNMTGTTADQDGAVSARSFCERVIRQVVVQSGRALVTAALAEAHGVMLDERDRAQSLFLDRPMDGQAHPDAVLDVALTLRRPIVAIGAPVATYYPTVAERLHTRLCIPPHAGIANAVGAVAGGVIQTVRAQIKLIDTGYRVHLPTGIHDFPDLEEAAAFAVEQAGRLATAQARDAGAVDVQTQTRRHDHVARVRREEIYEDMYIDTEVVSMAFGRPRLAER